MATLGSKDNTPQWYGNVRVALAVSSGTVIVTDLSGFVKILTDGLRLGTRTCLNYSESVLQNSKNTAIQNLKYQHEMDRYPVDYW